MTVRDLRRENEAALRVDAMRGFSKFGRWCCLAVIGLCSCTLTGARETAQSTDPFLSTVPAETPVANTAPAVRPGRVRLPNAAPPQIVQAAAEMPADLPPGAIVACPPDMRMPALNACDANGAMALGRVAGCEGSPIDYPDEYLFDGGDRGYPVHYDADGENGLDTEDTAAEYVDVAGKLQVRHSNRVALYAPRFGAVSTVSVPVADVKFDKAVGAVLARSGVGLRGRTVSVESEQRESTERVQTRSRVSGIDADAGGIALARTQGPQLDAQTLNVFQNVLNVEGVQFDSASEAQLAIGIQAAVIWTRTQFPTIAAKTLGATETKALKVSAEFVGLKPLNKQGPLCIIKSADKQEAEIGEVVTFTIHYVNSGDFPMGEVVIVDNLTPRLEYVPDSATSDRAGGLIEQDNLEGSKILRWELADPLPGKAGGTITFKARVK
jgi:uncharacterized repeat protein (TIGR01451 family)